MQQQLTCNQVTALLTYYVEKKLNKQLAHDIEYHLSICPECKKKFIQLKKIMNKYSDINEQYAQSENKTKNTEQTEKSKIIDKRYNNFKINLSAYIDNELSNEENLKVKKFAISNPIARKDLEEMYNFKYLLHSSFEKTKNDTKEDFAKNTLNQIFAVNKSNKLDKFYLIMMLFTIIIAVALLGIAYILQF